VAHTALSWLGQQFVVLYDIVWDGRLFHGWNDGARTLDSVGTSGLFKGGDVALCEWPNFNADIRLDGWGWASQKLS
jgi:hypothetical protein